MNGHIFIGEIATQNFAVGRQVGHELAVIHRHLHVDIIEESTQRIGNSLREFIKARASLCADANRPRVAFFDFPPN